MSERKKWPSRQNSASKQTRRADEPAEKNAFGRKGMKIQFIFLWSRPFISSFFSAVQFFAIFTMKGIFLLLLLPLVCVGYYSICMKEVGDEMELSGSD